MSSLHRRLITQVSGSSFRSLSLCNKKVHCHHRSSPMNLMNKLNLLTISPYFSKTQLNFNLPFGNKHFQSGIFSWSNQTKCILCCHPPNPYRFNKKPTLYKKHKFLRSSLCYFHHPPVILSKNNLTALCYESPSVYVLPRDWMMVS
jgi:hypothetical protein